MAGRWDEAALLLGLLLFASAARKRVARSAPPPELESGERGEVPPRAVPSRATRKVWERSTMEMFAEQCRKIDVDPHVVLLGIAAASNFYPDEQLGGHVGLLLVSREDLTNVGYPGVPPFEETTALHQLPWICKVIGYRVASSGGKPPRDVPELAVLLHPSNNPTITEAIRNEAARRAKEAAATSLYRRHQELLRSVLANP